MSPKWFTSKQRAKAILKKICLSESFNVVFLEGAVYTLEVHLN